ncbi:hypothetical protein MKJ01_13460 [Chryseobacterium sp. SSA4.19]|uniref:hypothetical protein n=1 Tax=Chryseobacterium sp. SSA4.19 TaxID=2919915 RepID=UPI001F4DF687|nr:hypothetical protein [Chryseobacterium sp. SSA4.19]MCJ8154773.1 hypothetical protein [Chryseobacterium sp. SSA4.19]
MKKNYILTLLFVLLFSFAYAQTTTFISEKTEQPMTKVSVFGKDGSIMAYSDIDGKIERKLLNPSQEKFQLVYDNILLGTFSYAELDKDIVQLNDRVKDIEPIVIKNNKPAKYLLIKGNFNAYVTVNNMLNCYIDGIATYIFDNKNKKVKEIKIQQYRIFRLENADNAKKQAGAWDYNTLLKLPALRHAGNLEKYDNSKFKVKELKTPAKDEIEISAEDLQDKELSFFGYRLFDVRGVAHFSFEKNSKKTLRDFNEYNEIVFSKFKHKTEPEYNQIISYKNFYPTELEFSNDNNIPGVKYNKNQSNYTSKYWEEKTFPNMQAVFSSFFKDDLKEK